MNVIKQLVGQVLFYFSTQPCKLYIVLTPDEGIFHLPS